MPCDRFEMDRVYTNIAFDPTSAHYVGATAITVPFQAYDEEGEIQLGPEGQCLTAWGLRYLQFQAGENLIPPTNERSSLELFSQGFDPWRVIDGYASFSRKSSVSPERSTATTLTKTSRFSAWKAYLLNRPARPADFEISSQLAQDLISPRTEPLEAMFVPLLCANVLLIDDVGIHFRDRRDSRRARSVWRRISPEIAMQGSSEESGQRSCQYHWISAAFERGEGEFGGDVPQLRSSDLRQGP